MRHSAWQLLFCAAPLLAPPGGPIAVPRTSEAWWAERIARKQTEARLAQPRVVLLGDSIFQELERRGPDPEEDFAAVWSSTFAPRRTLNLGFSGDTTSNLLWRLQHGALDGIRPRLVLVLIGTNDKAPPWYLDAAITAFHTRAILDAIRARLPEAHVLLLALLPSEVGQATNDAVNRDLTGIAASVPGVTWVDAGAALMRDGKPDRALYLDPWRDPPRPALHPNATGWRRIAAALEPLLGGRVRGRRPGPAPRATRPPIRVVDGLDTR